MSAGVDRDRQRIAPSNSRLAGRVISRFSMGLIRLDIPGPDLEGTLHGRPPELSRARIVVGPAIHPIPGGSLSPPIVELEGCLTRARRLVASNPPGLPIDVESGAPCFFRIFLCRGK